MRVVSAKTFSLCISPDRNAWASCDQMEREKNETAKNNSQKNILIISNIYRYNFMNKWRNVASLILYQVSCH